MINIKITAAITLILTVSISKGDNHNQQDPTQQQNQGTISYVITKHTISSGGGVITGGVYSLTSSIGQLDAGNNTGGIYKINGGFLTENSDLIFKNGFE